MAGLIVSYRKATGMNMVGRTRRASVDGSQHRREWGVLE